MTRVVVSSKKNFTVLQDGQMQSVILNQSSIVQIGVAQSDIKSIIKQGNDLVITLKNGEKIIINDFFNEMNNTEHTLAIPREDGSYAIAEFDATGKFVRYSPATELTQFASAEVPPQAAELSDGSDDFGVSKSQLVKAGLVALAAEGIYLWAVKDDDNDKSNNDKSTDITAPATPTAVLDADTQTITGKTEAKAKVEIKDTTGKVIASGYADNEGNYSIKLDSPLVNGNKVAVIAIDSAGNSSKATVVTGTKDTIAPDAPSAQLNADGTIVSGKAEANAKISVYDADGKLLGSVNANSSGLYSIKVSPPLTSDKGGTVVAEDAAGNKSDPSKVFAGKDTLAPDQPLIEVNQAGTSVLGKAEANVKVQIKDADGNIIGSGVADAQGKFQITISPALTGDHKGSIILEDAAGNQSKPLEITAGKDTIAPEKAVAQLNADGDSITGTAEANSKIEIRTTDGKTVLGSGTVGADGKFTIDLSAALTDKAVGKVYVIDASGNRSESTDVLGTKDTIAPNKPILQTVTDDVGDVKGNISAGGSTDDSKPSLTGLGEAKATLTIYDNGQPIGTVTVGDNGKWSFNITHDLALGSHTLTFTQTDLSGNTSEISNSFSFNVIAPTTMSSLLSNEMDTGSESAQKMSLVDHIDLNALLSPQHEAMPTQTTQEVTVDELLTSSTSNTSEIEDLLNQFVSTEPSTPQTDGNINTNLMNFEPTQVVQSGPWDDLMLLQHSIV